MKIRKLKPNILLFSIMYFNGTLNKFLNLTVSSAIDAKGGMLTILFNWIPNNKDSFFAAFLFVVTVLLLLSVFYLLSEKNERNSKFNEYDNIIAFFSALQLLHIFIFSINRKILHVYLTDIIT